MTERLDKLIASQGQYTRNEIKKIAAKGGITVNGIRVEKADVKVNAEQATIMVNGREIILKHHIYLMLNKPKVYTSTVEGNRHDMIMELIPEDFFREDLMPVGRLERDASGMMIITDDGELAHNILSPKKLVRKIYEITLDVPVTEKMKKRFSVGIEISAGENKSAELEITGDNTCRVTTLDGRYFQIKKMFEACGGVVTELHRICIGSLFMPDDMKPGMCRELATQELELLQKRGAK